MGMFDAPNSVFTGKIGPGEEGPLSRALGWAMELAGVNQAAQGMGAVNSALQGNFGDALTGAGALAFGLAPMAMGIRGFHGSPQAGLKVISASPAVRQFDNATSQFGAFFAPTEAGAQRYAGDAGKVYGADVPIENPYEMSWKEFNYFQSPNKTALRDSLPGEVWGSRADELRQEAAQFRETLAAAGHDGIVVRNPRSGQIQEMASFNDVPLGIRAYHESPNDFRQFDLGRVGETTDAGALGRALYFSTDPKVAEAGPHRYEVALNVANPLQLQKTEWGVPGRGFDEKRALVTKALDLPADASGEQIAAEAVRRGHDSVSLDYSPLQYNHQELAVFDPSLIQILRKYGILGPVAAPGALMPFMGDQQQ